MAIGLGVMGLAPRDFWAMTPRELDSALRGRLGSAAEPAPSRAELHKMMSRFPDQGEGR